MSPIIVQRLGPRAYLVLEKIFKGFYHIWAWQPCWSMDHAHFSNLSFSCPKEAPHEIWATQVQRLQRRSHLKLSTFFPYKCMTSPKKGQTSMYGHHFSNFGRPPIPDDLCKDSAIRHSRFWRSRFFKVFIIFGHGSHLGQWMATILAIFHSPAPGRLQITFQQCWPRGSRGVRNSQHFSNTHA